jgi:hypothetical protein
VGIAVLDSDYACWDRLLWHGHPGLFPGPEVALSHAALALLVPLLVLAQTSHYVPDAWVWRVRPENADLARYLGFERPPLPT